jgi:hypothetical protein
MMSRPRADLDAIEDGGAQLNVAVQCPTSLQESTLPFVTAEQRVEVWEDDLVVRLNAKVATALHSSKNAEHALGHRAP